MTIRLVNEGDSAFGISGLGKEWIIPPSGGGKWVSDVEKIKVKDPVSKEDIEVRKAVLVKIEDDPHAPNYADLPDEMAVVLARGEVAERMRKQNVRRHNDVVASAHDEVERLRDERNRLLAQQNAIIQENERLKRQNDELGTSRVLSQLGATQGEQRKEKR